MTKILNRKGWVAVGVYSLILLAGGFYAGNRNFSEKTTVVEKEKSKETVDIVEKIVRSEEHTSELQSPCNLVCRLLLEKKNMFTTENKKYSTDKCKRNII